MYYNPSRIILLRSEYFELILSCVSDVSDGENIRGDDGGVAQPGDLPREETTVIHFKLLNRNHLIVSKVLTFNHKIVWKVLMRWEFFILVSNQNKLAFEVMPKY